VNVQRGGIALRRRPMIDRPREPAGSRLVRAQRGGLPDRHALEMRAIRVGIAHTLDDREPLLLKELGKPIERRMQANMVVDLFHIRSRDLDRRPLFSIRVVAIGNNRVQAVVATIELDDHQNAAFRVGRWPIRQRSSRAGQKQRDSLPAGEQGRGAEAQADHLAASRMHGALQIKLAGTQGNW
jgi:hypothetical protein